MKLKEIRELTKKGKVSAKQNAKAQRVKEKEMRAKALAEENARIKKKVDNFIREIEVRIDSAARNGLNRCSIDLGRIYTYSEDKIRQHKIVKCLRVEFKDFKPRLFTESVMEHDDDHHDHYEDHAILEFSW